jgi:hypothetical protein
MRSHFTYERSTCGESRYRAMVDRLEVAAIAAVMAENDSGGQARHVVAEVARVLGVDIDDGPGHRWDPEHMARVVGGANQIRDDRDHWQQEAENREKDADLWKSLAQRQDNVAPVRMKLQSVERERDALKSEHAKAMGDAAYWRHAWEEDKGPDVDELKAVIVSQAREIARLKGESE